MTRLHNQFLLIADDYGLNTHVSQGILHLVRQKRLSGTSAMVNMVDWPEAALAAVDLRAQCSLGLHLNLTLGEPVGAMPHHAPDDALPNIRTWIIKSVTRTLDLSEVEAEIDRQIDLFIQTTGFAPDHIDGHHHVHALPGIRHALANCLKRRFSRSDMPLVRNPSDHPGRCVARGAALPKALLLSALGAGTYGLFKAIGCPVNQGFSGFSPFDLTVDFAEELSNFERAPGPAHMIMCHPGYYDESVPEHDHICKRRLQELTVLEKDANLPQRLKHPARYRAANGHIDWETVLAW